MKKLKLILTAIMAVSMSIAFAQNATTFGIRAGVNFQNINGKDGAGDNLENDLVARWNAGVNAEIPIAPDFYIQPGIMFSTKGTKLENSETKINLGYVEVPIHVVYKPLLGTGRLILGFGPYVGYGLTGKVKSDNGDETDVEFESEVDLADLDGSAYFKPLDVGANLFFGYEFANMLSLQLNTQLGLTDIFPDVQGLPDGDDTKYTNTGFGLSLGFRF